MEKFNQQKSRVNGTFIAAPRISTQGAKMVCGIERNIVREPATILSNDYYKFFANKAYRMRQCSYFKETEDFRVRRIRTCFYFCCQFYGYLIGGL